MVQVINLFMGQDKEVSRLLYSQDLVTATQHAALAHAALFLQRYADEAYTAPMTLLLLFLLTDAHCCRPKQLSVQFAPLGSKIIYGDVRNAMRLRNRVSRYKMKLKGRVHY